MVLLVFHSLSETSELAEVEKIRVPVFSICAWSGSTLRVGGWVVERISSPLACACLEYIFLQYSAGEMRSASSYLAG